jgi:hypothetical protein
MYAESHKLAIYSKCHYAKCCYTECRYAECRGAEKNVSAKRRRLFLKHLTALSVSDNFLSSLVTTYKTFVAIDQRDSS